MSQSEDDHKSTTEQVSDEVIASASPGNKVRLCALGLDDIPQVYQHNLQGNPCVRCTVCETHIDIKGKEGQYVVRCHECKEATPIRMPPSDRKNIRCVCNCLLICRAEASRIICPRQNCHRIVDIEHSSAGRQTPGQAEGMDRLACAYCNRHFLVNTSDRRHVRCPHCEKRSALGKKYIRHSAMVYLTIAIIAAMVGAICLSYTFHLAKRQIGYYILYVCLFLTAILSFLRSLYYFLMPVSLTVGLYRVMH